jgi:maltose-binding protein MalE
LELAEGFEAEYGVGLIVEEVSDIFGDFTIAAPAGEGPDIFIGPHDRIGGVIESGLLAPIDLGAKADLFTDLSLEGFTYQDGLLYGMPYAVENLAFFYNTELVPEPPTTWDEVVAMGTALQEAGDVTYGFALTGTTYDMFPLQTSFGGYIFGQDADGSWDAADVGIDSEGMIATGEWLQERLDEGFMDSSTDWDTAHNLFEQGEIPFLMAGPWALSRIRESGVPYGITSFPVGTTEGRPFAGVQGFMINALSDNVPLAQAFLTEFVATDEVMQQLQDAGQRPSAFKSVLEATTDEDLLTFGEVGLNASLMPSIPAMGSVWGSWDSAFALILNGDETPDAALTNGAEQIRAAIAGEG